MITRTRRAELSRKALLIARRKAAEKTSEYRRIMGELRWIKTADDCLNYLEQLVKDGVNVIANSYWQIAEERYQKIIAMFPNEEYARRYDAIIKILDARHEKMITEMHHEDYP